MYAKRCEGACVFATAVGVAEAKALEAQRILEDALYAQPQYARQYIADAMKILDEITENKLRDAAHYYFQGRLF